MNRVLRVCAPLLAIALLTAGRPASARDEGDHEAARAALARGEILPLTRILALVAQHSRGDILSVELDRHDKRIIYEVKVLTLAGKVTEVQLDAKTGAVVEDEDDKDARARR